MYNFEIGIAVGATIVTIAHLTIYFTILSPMLRQMKVYKFVFDFFNTNRAHEVSDALDELERNGL